MATSSLPRTIRTICSSQKTWFRNGSGGRRSCCGAKGSTAHGGTQRPVLILRHSVSEDGYNARTSHVGGLPGLPPPREHELKSTDRTPIKGRLFLALHDRNDAD